MSSKRHRDAGSGEFVSKQVALAHPSTTVSETIKKPEFKSIVSSNLHSAAHIGGAIVVRFLNGTAYRYPNCSADLWKDFQKQFDGKAGRSAGKFLNAKLRPKAYERLDDWK